ncbi:acylphosphatase [Nesterenkonia marinintestina]|uniref:acylphosphatase n=1 Tax=Nesterenkonia marinintestina TaxID=2979865 RepID=UPI0021BF0BF3|nr:acylphosphatase [Nesterenkonia sp. GX14115]
MGDHPEGRVSGNGHAELMSTGEHVLLPKDAWETGESVLGALIGEDILLGHERDIRRLIAKVIDGASMSGDDHTDIDTQNDPDDSTEEPSYEAHYVVLRAVKEALWAFFVGQPDEHADNELGNLLNSRMDQVSRYFVAPSPAAPRYEGEAANAFVDAPFIKPLPKDGTKGHLLEREALRYGMSSTRYPNGAFVVKDPLSQRELGFKWGRAPLASGVALSICSYKEATRRLLKRVDVPVPQGRVFSADDGDLALDYADRIGYPVVCKPVAGLRGIGVVADIGSRAELEDALELYRKSQLGDDDFVIEEHVPGEDYRIVVIGDRVVAAVVRAPASVTGDGTHTVADLIEYKNRARRENPHLSSRPITCDPALEYQLKLHGLTYSSIPAAGHEVTLANSANLSQGGDSFEVANELHPSIKELAVKAVGSVPGLGFCGLDMLIEDHTKPVWEQTVTVIELNAHAAIGSAQYPMWGTPAPVAKALFEATCEDAGVDLPMTQSEELSLALTIRGRVKGVKYRKWFHRRACEFGLDGYVENRGRNRVQAVISGDADAVSALCYLAMQGPEKAIPTSVTAMPTSVDVDPGFSIRREESRDTQNRISPLVILRRAVSAFLRRGKSVIAS